MRSRSERRLWIHKRPESNGDAAHVMRAVASRLRALDADGNSDPLEVIRLRGGVQSSVPTDPSRPAVLLSTLPMFGSRLLFRGYGSSRSMRPIDAALSGTDSLILVDEAHLAKHLIRLVPDLAECTRDARPVLGGTRSRPQVVALTATGDASARDRFDLDPEDEANSIVRQRLDAAKSIRVRSVARGSCQRDGAGNPIAAEKGGQTGDMYRVRQHTGDS